MQFTWLDSNFSGPYKRCTDAWKGSYCILGNGFPINRSHLYHIYMYGYLVPV